MKLWTCNKFEGHYPVGTAAIVRATTAEIAASRLNTMLQEFYNLRGNATADMMEEFTDRDTCRVLCDGNY